MQASSPLFVIHWRWSSVVRSFVRSVFSVLLLSLSCKQGTYFRRLEYLITHCTHNRPPYCISVLASNMFICCSSTTSTGRLKPTRPFSTRSMSLQVRHKAQPKFPPRLSLEAYRLGEEDEFRTQWKRRWGRPRCVSEPPLRS